MGNQNHRRRENVDLFQVRVTRWNGKHVKGENKKERKKQKLEKKAKDGKVTLGRSEGQGIFFCESSHVRLADCPRHTAEKSI